MMMGDRWKALIVRELLTGTKRFGQLKKGLNGISPKVLTDHLRIMEEIFADRFGAESQAGA